VKLLLQRCGTVADRTTDDAVVVQRSDEMIRFIGELRLPLFETTLNFPEVAEPS